MESSKGGRVLGNDFWYKTLPVLIVGMIIWTLTTLIFSGIIGPIQFRLTLGIVILLMVLYFILWIVTIILAMARQNFLSMIIFFNASMVSGMLSSTLLIWASAVLRLELVLGLFFIAFVVGLLVLIGLLILGLSLRERISDKFIYPLLLFGFILLVLEVSIILIFGFNPILLITSILVLIWLFGVILWDGSRLPETIEEGYWMLAALDIFLDLINVILRIFIILVEIIADSS
jgi:hypothetical protein